MNYIKKSLLATSLLGTSLFSINANAESFQIDDFRFALNDASFGSWQTPQGAQDMNPSLYGTLVEGAYQGTNSTSILINFNFFGGPVHASTSLTNGGASGVFPPGGGTEFGSLSPASSISGGPQPTIDLVNLTADMSSWFAEWNGTDFNQGTNTNWTACENNPIFDQLSDVAIVTDNLDGTFRVNWNSCITGGTFNAQIGYWQLDMTCLTCAATVLGNADIFTATQGGANTKTVSKIDGNVVITSSFGATPANFLFSWSNSGNITDADGNITDGTFTFDPSGLAIGNYIFNSTYTDNNTSPDPTKGTGEIIIRVVDSIIGDTEDSNGNGIENKDDAGLAGTQMQSVLGVSNTTYVLEVSSGTLRLGKTAFCAGTAARLTNAELTANASDSCETNSNTSDDLIKAVGIGGYYDFEVTGIASGETVDIVIPLTAAIPKSAVYRKYTVLTGWGTFISVGNDKLSSASSTSEGICPAPSSTVYTSGLTQGDNCIRLSITDGGPNDADNSANGLIKDPGAVAEINSGTKANLSSGCSLSGKPATLNNHSEWLLLFTLIAWLGLSNRARKQP